MRPVGIIGASSSGCAMAAHLMSAGVDVHLWNRSPGRLDAIRAGGGIAASGAVAGRFTPDVLTGDMAEALDGVELILVAVPANAHADVAAAAAPHLKAAQTILLNPGRTCGALEVDGICRAAGADVTVAETQTILYTCRPLAPGSVAVLTLKTSVKVAALESARTRGVIASLPECIRGRFTAAGSVLETSLGNVGMILHPAVVLAHADGIRSAAGPPRHYHDGITPLLAARLERLDAERLAAAAALGLDLPSVAEWMRRAYGVDGRNLHECIRANDHYATIDAPTSLRHRYLLEDVPTGLVPAEAIGKAIGLPMTLTTACIDEACAALADDLRATGRNAAKLGIASATTADEVAAAIGGR